MGKYLNGTLMILYINSEDKKINARTVPLQKFTNSVINKAVQRTAKFHTMLHHQSLWIL